jgi:cytochrome c-type biogenesis protein CcmH/NrfF
MKIAHISVEAFAMTAKHLVLIACVVLAATAAHAQPTDVDRNAQRLFSQVMSPYCPGLLLADCPSPDAFALRAEIRARLAAGEAPADVENDLYARFGNSIRATPEPRRWGLLLWVVPLVVFAASVGGLAWYLAQRRPIQPPPARATDLRLEARLEDELERL